MKNILFITGIFLIIFFIVLINLNNIISKNNQFTTNNQTNLKPIYTKDESMLKTLIDDEKQIEKLDIYYALSRLTNSAIFKYPFTAVKDPKGEGYIGIVAGIKSSSGNLKGKAVFLVSFDALNQTNKNELEMSIKAINGLAKNFNQNIQYAQGYDYLQVIKWVENNK